MTGRWGFGFTGVLLALAGCAGTPPTKQALPAVDDADAIQVVRIQTLGPDGPVAARCGVKNDRGTSEILAPGVAEVYRSPKPLEVLCFAQGYRIAMRSIESTGDVIGPAATGVVAGGTMTAIAALPLLTVPVFGPFMYAGAVGSGALVGGAVNAADKHSQGKIYSYPPSAIMTLVPEDALPGAPVRSARPLLSAEPVPPAAAPGLTAAPMAAAAPMSVPRSAAPGLRPVHHEVPPFPPEAAQAGLTEGRVRARVGIDNAGNVTRVDILEARPPSIFDRVVTQTLARWKFEPGEGSRTFETEVEFRR